ncbi:MAG: hypothetical protein QOD39_3334, partial [Mycobacterium sp.]|nr:hypothetical protein [Mycobacterium sp.]
IDALCERLNVTKGSFYWHFTDMQEYRAALAGAWGNMHDERRRRFDDIHHLDPRRRLTVIVQSLVRPDRWALERAMRVWALADETVLANVQRSDGRVMYAVRQAFVDYGFTDEEADLRTSVLFATTIGLLHGAGSTHDAPAPLRERVVDFMLSR